MAEARAYSPSFASVQQLADRALESAEGITVYFTVKTHGSLEGCAFAARSLQKTFTSLRARARRPHERALGEVGPKQAYVPRWSNAQGIYDKLICQRAPLADGEGWSIALLPSGMMLDAMDVRDNATGLPLGDVGRSQDRLHRIVMMGQNNPAGLTLDDYDFGVEKGVWWNDDGSCWLERNKLPASANLDDLDVKTVGQDHLLPDDDEELTFGDEEN